MDVFSILDRLDRGTGIALYGVALIAGAFVGVFVLHPVNEFVYFHEHSTSVESAGTFVMNQVRASLMGINPGKTLFYAAVGSVLGMITAAVYASLHRRLLRIQVLQHQLDKDVHALIAQGEGPELEFKSSFRWDVHRRQANKGLEIAVLKTLAGFMNGSGGTLLIGVSDDGSVLGVEHDYTALKRRNQDGFEQALMTSVATSFGADACRFVQILFHNVSGADICRVIVARSSRPVFLKQGKETRFFVRTGGGTRDLNVQEATEYVGSHWS